MMKFFGENNNSKKGCHLVCLLVKIKLLFVMGASSGIGEETTKKLSQEGAKLVIAARREDRLKALVESLPNAAISYVVADVTNNEEVQAVFDLAVEKYGRVDVLYNNAGIMPHALLSEKRFDEWRQMLDINIMGVLNGIAAALAIMKKQQSGQIVTTDSVAGHVVFQKGAVIVELSLLFVPSWKGCAKKNVKIIFAAPLSLQER